MMPDQPIHPATASALVGRLAWGRCGTAGSTVVLLIAANALAWVWAFAQFAGRPALLGTALLAYIFGLRHAVDADHIAAIDNVVRKLMQDGGRPRLVGLFFSLGHSTVVVLATIVIAATATGLQGQIEAIKQTGSAVGTSVSALFLLVIALVNLVILRDVWSSFQKLRRGRAVAHDDGTDIVGHGALAGLCRPLFRMIGRSWHMYPLGLLFGLGFDTATEIGLLGISATQASQGLSPYAILIFPALFTTGMALVDTIDGMVMVGAYGWAFVNPARKLWYNLTITAVSVFVALLIGGIEALGLLAAKLNLSGWFWTKVGALNEDLTSFGLVVIGVFVAGWAASVLIYRWARVDDLVPERRQRQGTLLIACDARARERGDAEAPCHGDGPRSRDRPEPSLLGHAAHRVPRSRRWRIPGLRRCAP
jgi:nickel/cobalt transporter (NiCoT) family protein